MKIVTILVVSFILCAYGQNCGLMPCQNIKCPGALSGTYSPCRTFFRLDDIQDFDANLAQISIMEVFHANNTPLTVGLIPGNFGLDKTLLSYLSQTVENTMWEVEIAVHGDNHTDFSQYSLAQTSFLLQDALNTILRILRVANVHSFIPPFGRYGANLVPALQQTGFTHWSSDIIQDFQLPKPLIGQTLYAFPVGASTNTNFSDYSVFIPTPWQTTFNQIATQLKTYGWAGVTLHPKDFSNSGGIANQTLIDGLDMLVLAVQQQGWEIVPLGRLNLDAPNITLTGGVVPIPSPNQVGATIPLGTSYYIVLGVVAGVFVCLCFVFSAAFVKQTISYYSKVPVELPK